VGTEQAVYQVVDSSGIARGSAFAIDKHTAITCVHVVAGSTDLELRALGVTIKAQVDKDNTIHDLDLAVLRTQELLSAIWPIEYDWREGDNLELSGYQLQRVAPGSPYPTLGRIAGSTTVPYLSFSGKGVLRVENAVVEPGLSGSPAILLGEGVVIGVVVSRFEAGGGFVIPFSRVPRDSGLSRTLETNRTGVPRFGRFLNASGLREAATHFTAGVLDDLKRQGRYTPGRHVRRDKAMIELFRSLSDRARICVITGPSGVGKTHFVAAAAEELSENDAVLLLRAAACNFSSLDSFIALATSTNESDIGMVLDRLFSSGTRLIVVIDGLNEAPVPLKQIHQWLLNADRRLGTRGVTLVIGCRPEFWTLVKSVVGKPVPIELGWFSDDERKKASALYRVDSDLRAFSYPLLLRLASEQPHGSRTPISVSSAVEQYARLVVEKATVDVEGQLTEGQVWSRVMSVGRALASRGDLRMPLAEYETLCGPFPLPAALINEGLFQEGPLGIRPLFDEVGYWMQAEALAAEPIASILELNQSVFLLTYALPRRPPNDVELAVRYTLHHDSALNGLLKMYTLAFALSQLSAVTLSDATLKELAEEALAAGPHVVDTITILEPLLFADALSDESLLKLLWYLAPIEDEYPFRVKDWDGDLIHRRRAEDFPAPAQWQERPFELASFVVRTAVRSADAFEQVLSWTTDPRPLRRETRDSTEATVGSWAVCIVLNVLALRFDEQYLHRALQFNATTIAETRSMGGHDYIMWAFAQALVARWPSVVLDYWEARLRKRDSRAAAVIVHLAAPWYVSPALAAFNAKQWNDIRALAFDLVDDESQQVLAWSLAPDVKTFEDWVLASVAAGRWKLSLRQLEPIVNRRASEFLNAIQPLLNAAPRGHAHVAAEVLAALLPTIQRQPRKTEIVGLVQQYWSVFPHDDRYHLSVALEQSMADDNGMGLLDHAVLTLGEWILRQPKELRAESLIHGTFAAVQRGTPELVDAAFHVLERIADVDTVTRALIYQGPKRLPFVRGWPMTREAARRLDGMRDGPSLMNAICNGEDTWQIEFLRWLRDPLQSADAAFLLRDLRDKMLGKPVEQLFWTAVEVRDSHGEAR
jgi:hypothetical protein